MTIPLRERHPAVTVVVGNPRTGSRTRDAGIRVGFALTDHAPKTVIELSALGPGLLGWGDPSVDAAMAAVTGSDLVVFASPTFKASYTGLLKLFLDQFASRTGLSDVLCVPVMLGAGAAHAFTADHLLRPILSELGGTCAVPGLYLVDSTYLTDNSIDTYARTWRPLITKLLAT